MNKIVVFGLLAGGFYLLTNREVNKLKDLKVTLGGIKKIDISSGSIVIDLDAKVTNDSNISVKVERIDYVVKMGGHLINTGTVSTPFVLDAKKSILVPVRASSNISISIFSALASIINKQSAIKTYAKLTLEGGKELNFEF